ncbi:hypothetical protein VNO78_11628 [Psophocarpus tetragonolobus]|uniref:Uncharacterized protein n=1 Tax=Psophocarpus tetragonolobus TaxID=3891 RepID=A0AAN9SM59_PSOTE
MRDEEKRAKDTRSSKGSQEGQNEWLRELANEVIEIGSVEEEDGQSKNEENTVSPCQSKKLYHDIECVCLSSDKGTTASLTSNASLAAMAISIPQLEEVLQQPIIYVHAMATIENPIDANEKQPRRAIEGTEAELETSHY